MSSTKQVRALIVGGGLGGLAAAIALRHAGIEVAVFERASDLRQLQVGAGMVLWPNGMRALQRIGLAETVKAAGAVLDSVEFCPQSGPRLATWAVGDLGRRLGAVTLAISRAELHRALVGALDDGCLHLGAECADFVQDDAGVTVRMVDGREERGDVLIAADGLHSVVRTQQLGEGRPHYPPYAGYTIWHAIIPRDDPRVPRGVFRLLFGCGSRFAYYYVDRHRVYRSGIGYVPENTPEPEEGREAGLLRRFGGYAEPVKALINATDAAAIHRVDIFGSEPLPRWGEGRVTMLGDAAHPMTTNMGQGACMAIEDGAALGQHLRGRADLVGALRDYEARRIRRTTQMMQLVQRFNSTASREGSFQCWLRNQLIHYLFKRGLGRRVEAQIAQEW
jgi:2-polyprenyl-6-methoxyphenol hydroxylase-like FAD-dependent oxidoreductase